MSYPADIPGSQRVYLSDPATGLPYGQGVGIPISSVSSGTTPRGVFTIAAGGLATTVGLPNIPGDATTALVIPDGAGLRWRDDGTDPTPLVGVPAPVGSFLKLYGPEIAATKFIAQAAGASLTVRYGK